MPGFLYRHTLIFDGPGKGWQEALYFERPTRDLDAAFTFVADVKNKRAKLLGAQYSIKGERVVLVQTDLGQRVTREGFAKRFFVAGVQAQPGEDTGTSLLVKWVKSDGTRQKLMYMGGVYAALFPFANAVDPNVGQWQTNFQSWRTLMRTLGMGWLHRVEAQKAAITTYSFDQDTGHVTYTLEAPGITWPAGKPPTPVNVEFPLGRSPLDGPQIVVPLNATSAVTAKPRPAQPFTVNGVMKTFTTEFVNIGTLNNVGLPGFIFEEKPVNRKRGRPLLESRGRAPAQARW